MSEEKCPYVATGKDGTQFCALAEHTGCVLNEWRARAEKAEAVVEAAREYVAAVQENEEYVYCSDRQFEARLQMESAVEAWEAQHGRDN